jgi:hypothetical protein
VQRRHAGVQAVVEDVGQGQRGPEERGARAPPPSAARRTRVPSAGAASQATSQPAAGDHEGDHEVGVQAAARRGQPRHQAAQRAEHPRRVREVPAAARRRERRRPVGGRHHEPAHGAQHGRVPAAPAAARLRDAGQAGRGQGCWQAFGAGHEASVVGPAAGPAEGPVGAPFGSRSDPIRAADSAPRRCMVVRRAPDPPSRSRRAHRPRPGVRRRAGAAGVRDGPGHDGAVPRGLPAVGRDRPGGGRAAHPPRGGERRRHRRGASARAPLVRLALRGGQRRRARGAARAAGAAPGPDRRAPTSTPTAGGWWPSATASAWRRSP